MNKRDTIKHQKNVIEELKKKLLDSQNAFRERKRHAEDVMTELNCSKYDIWCLQRKLAESEKYRLRVTNLAKELNGVSKAILKLGKTCEEIGVVSVVVDPLREIFSSIKSLEIRMGDCDFVISDLSDSGSPTPKVETESPGETGVDWGEW